MARISKSRVRSLNDRKTQVILRIELKKLEEDGRVLPERVVRAAKAVKHPLHRFFEWNVKKAAEQYWLDRAREIIRTVKLEVQINERTISTVCYVHDPRLPSGKSGYVEAASLARDPKSARAMVDNEFAQAEALLERARALAEIVGVLPEAKEALSQVQRGRQKIREQQPTIN